MPTVTLLGPQRFTPTLGEAVARAGISGRLASVTAGWQEREAEDLELHEHLGERTLNLMLYARSEDAFERDPELAAAYRSADCFVFPSLTDTFGLVVIEALACGVPVAAFPVAGPMDILGRHGKGIAEGLEQPVGALDDNLCVAIQAALRCDRQAAADFGATHTWEYATDLFLDGIAGATAAVREGSRLELA